MMVGKQEILEKALYNEFMDNPTISSKDREVFVKGGLFGYNWQKKQNVIDTDDAYSEGFENGKKHQQERSYSEEEVLNLLISKEDNTKDSTKYNGVEYITPKEWFEQFKKK